MTHTILFALFTQRKTARNLIHFQIPCFRSNLYYDIVFRDTFAGHEEFDDLKDFVEKVKIICESGSPIFLDKVVATEHYFQFYEFFRLALFN